MRITINGRTADGLSDAQERDVRLASAWAAVQGSVLDSGAAAAKVLTGWRNLCIGFVVVVWLVLYAMVATATPGDRVALGNFGLVLAVLTPLAMGVVYYIKRERLYASLPARSHASPPTGTTIGIDGSGVTIGSRSAVWKDVAVDGVDFDLVSAPRGYRVYFIKRLHLRLGDVPFVLDRSLLADGAALVDGIYRRKFR
jgi:hypothetical protein